MFNTPAADLEASARSALEQNGGGVQQLILIDDKSTCSTTLDKLQELGSVPGVSVITAARNGGPAAARNLGLDAASAEWVAFLDADDLWPCDKLDHARTTLAANPDARWIVGQSATLDINGVIAAQPGLGVWSDGRACRPELTRAIVLNGLHLGTGLIRREMIDGHRFEPAVRFGEDLLFLAKLSLTSCACRADGIAYISRRQRTSLMWSAARLSNRFASGPRAGLRDPALREFRREYRWALYAVYKDMAVNNLINGRRPQALLAALQALRLDPREISEFGRFLRLLPLRDKAVLSREARNYCGCEQVWLSTDGTVDGAVGV